MAEYNANIVVQPYNIDINLTQPGITVNPDVTSLNIYAVGGTNGQPAGNVGDLQYYAANGFAAVPSNVANYTGGNLNLNVANTKITGGTNGYVLQTDGAGNISWTAQTGGGGSGSPGGSNTQIQFNDSGLFGGFSGFTFNKSTNLVSMPGSANIVGDISANNANFSGNVNAVTVTANVNGSATTAGTVTTAAQPNITSVGTLTGLTSSGTIETAGLKVNSSKVSIGQNAGLTAQGTSAVAIGFEAARTNQGNSGIAIGTAAGYDFQGSNAIAIGYYAGYPGNAAGQGANSIAIGALAGYPQQAGNSIVINATNANLPANTANAFYVKPVRNSSTSNVLHYNTTTGEITYGSFNPSILSNGTSNVNIPTANSNITLSVNGTSNVLVVTDTGIVVNGNANVGNLSATGVSATTLGGTLTTGAQPNITSIGTLTSLSLNSPNIELGQGAQADGDYAIAIGETAETANTVALDTGIAVGRSSFAGNGSVTFGAYAGKFVSEKAANATSAVTIGQGAGYGNNRGSQTVAVGSGSGVYQRSYSVALGSSAGTYAGSNSIAIGYKSSFSNVYYDNTIILNASGNALNPTTANALFVKPIRNATQSNYLYYDATSGEITYDTGTGGGNTAAGSNTQVQFNSANLLDASPNFTFNSSSNTLTVNGTISSNVVNATSLVGSGSNITGINANNLSAGTVPSARLSGSYNINISGSASTAGTVTTAAQPSITSVGTLTGLSVNGNAAINKAKINSGLVQSVQTTATTSGNVTIFTDSYETLLCTNQATGNFNLNINTSIGVNESVSARFIIQQNSNVAYGVDPVNFYINGVNQAPKLRMGGSALSFVGYTVYDIQVINTSGGYSAFLLRTQVS